MFVGFCWVSSDFNKCSLDVRQPFGGFSVDSRFSLHILWIVDSLSISVGLVTSSGLELPMVPSALIAALNVVAIVCCCLAGGMR